MLFCWLFSPASLNKPLLDHSPPDSFVLPEHQILIVPHKKGQLECWYSPEKRNSLCTGEDINGIVPAIQLRELFADDCLAPPLFEDSLKT